MTKGVPLARLLSYLLFLRTEDQLFLLRRQTEGIPGREGTGQQQFRGGLLHPAAHRTADGAGTLLLLLGFGQQGHRLPGGIQPHTKGGQPPPADRRAAGR